LTAPAGQAFNTAPAPGNVPADGNTHILILGDSGTATEDGHEGEAAQVLAGYEAYSAANGGEAVDLLLALGDNAYVAGTDDQWQGAFFDLYADILKGAQPVTTIGNHEMGYGILEICLLAPSVPCGIFQPIAGTSTSDDPNDYASEANLDANGDLIPDGIRSPYLDIFSLPDNGQSGGSPSGTEQYYSVDYGNVHVVSLDTQLTARDDTTREAMRQWLIADLSANSLDWTVVIFHHPPYTKGRNHDSDDTEDNIIDRPEWDIRNDFTPVFEDYGVDVVYSGHSHSYERSYYLSGHTGTSDTFDPALHAELNAANEPSLGKGADTYAQLSPTSGGVDDRVVYTVAGSAGKADSGGGATTTDEEWLRHTAHIIQTADTACGTVEGCRRGLGMMGSVVLDATASELTAKFVDVNGAVIDDFTITR
jgi:3',5'-cyclic AMP phosphodiesterase CpdA